MLRGLEGKTLSLSLNQEGVCLVQTRNTSSKGGSFQETVPSLPQRALKMGKVFSCVLQDSGSQTRKDDHHVVLTIGDESRFS